MSVPFDEMRNRLGADTTGSTIDPIARRDFMKLLGASLALAGVDGCTRMPASNIHPYVHQPELTPGIAQHYATVMAVDGYATGLLVESHEGRPTKIEGNPDHPASLGATGVLEQASVLQLYDPDRARRIRHDAASASWDALAALLGPESLASRAGARGGGLALLLAPTSSPLEEEVLHRVLERYPDAHLCFYAPLMPALPAHVTQWSVGDADVILAVDTDFLASGPFHLRHARAFAGRRRPESAPGGMNRLYVVESSISVTGMGADHRHAVRPRDISSLLERLLAAIAGESRPSSPDDQWLNVVAADLRAHAGRSLVIAGPLTPPAVQTLALAINQALGNIDRTIWFTRSPLAGAGGSNPSLSSIADRMRGGDITTLICAGVNASYASEGRMELGAAIRRVPEAVYLGLYEDETARDCHWIVPAAHYLESWGDARAYDGTLSVVQPLIEPLAGGRTLVELLSLLLGDAHVSPYDLLRDTWRARGDLARRHAFEDDWRDVLRRGLLPGSGFPRESAPPSPSPIAAAMPATAPFDVVFRPHPRVRDGAFANSGWLQELPDPVTTVTWENVAQVSAATAQRLALTTGDLVDIRVEGRSVQLPAVVVGGHADDTATITFGHGRTGAESVARGAGANVYPLWPGDRFSRDVTVSRASGSRQLAITQPHRSLDGSAAVQSIDAGAHAVARPDTARPLPLYRAPSTGDTPSRLQWAMTIDLSACTGCGACMVACQAENNVPVVGRDQVLLGREMHWLRIDWYAQPDAATTPQPMLCQHCEAAPCEYVCPVEATVHSQDGLNEMVYNRCVGTRFCSNNCPYKVRRFNWFDFNAGGGSERLVRNPDVTVRERGVMEKCTFCVQRIREAEIHARAEGQALRGSEVQTACEQACPTQAILFGSLDERDSAMMHARVSERAYAVLDELGTVPRVRYLARVRNPNPALESRA
ncbi:MAG TPA: 4Fe-4S dicluster domain-containing protein [Vicinamibacterales bacterium]|nr:4Fe-4S dicluster domain-containing protein [Vicinamibacterales bacterium]